ncbi:MAG TPA: BON domain-containing protein [Gemmatimonadales bacterium]|nr:BON domain-containing protein [Gemmatimonadales bacterium]
MRPRLPPSTSELIAWMLVGTGLGFAAGLLLAEWLGPMDPGRVKRAAEHLARGRAAPPRPPALARAVRQALRLDRELRDAEIETVPGGPGTVELHGWVASRSLRARAGRIASTVTGVDTVINGLLVRGEDDPGLPLPAAGDQTA